MKSTIFKTLALCFMALSLWSCKKDETQTVSNVEPAGTLTASATTINLVQANGTKEALQLTYPLATSSGYVVPVTSTLQFGLKGKNFDPVREVVVTSKTYAPTIADFNNMILALGGKVNEAAQIEVRLKSGAAVNDLTYSNVITLSATPYLASAWIYVPGAYQGWNPSTADSLISLSSDGVYTGMIAYTEGNLEFKITPAKKWDVAYGDAGSGSISTSAGDNLKSPAAIVKQVTVDLNKKTIVFGTPNEWSIIGDATAGGWATDTDMKGTNDGKSNFYILKTALGVGEMKFRFQHDWKTNLGGSPAALTAGGDNIKITAAGNYTITLDVAANKATIVKN
ncbi:SusE domain-containing protein [Pedobacter endophyticus]|uniref:SusE domain-containing protein n=1 Tax=Pedobacter endophyticus TaxID=2789740 RepID=A0A7S9L2Z7_9SPHI|nr:SusE domain-containing protein [Pedobacter endophyticus]QPH41545.1 SusE domain-containing protein [Pedobacter endophyticus]